LRGFFEKKKKKKKRMEGIKEVCALTCQAREGRKREYKRGRGKV
jgi:hypothetical protein